jgi:hypothetical protein
MKKTLYLATGLVALSIFTSCSVDMPKMKEKPVKSVKTEVTEEIEAPKEVEEAKTADHTTIEGFWKDFQSHVIAKDKEGLMAFYADSYKKEAKNCLADEDLNKMILAKTFEDFKAYPNPPETERATPVYSMNFEFLPSAEDLNEYPEMESSGQEYFIQKTDDGIFVIYFVGYYG